MRWAQAVDRALLGFAQVGFAQVGFAQVGFAQVGFAQVGFAQMGFELCEGLLDRVEIRAVGRKVEQPAPAASIASCTPATLWAGKLSMTTMSSGCSTGMRVSLT